MKLFARIFEEAKSSKQSFNPFYANKEQVRDHIETVFVKIKEFDVPMAFINLCSISTKMPYNNASNNKYLSQLICK